MDFPVEIHEHIINYLSRGDLRAYAATGKTCRALVKRCRPPSTLSVEIFSAFFSTVTEADSSTLASHLVLTSAIDGENFIFPDDCFDFHFSRPSWNEYRLSFRFSWKNVTWTTFLGPIPGNLSNITSLTRPMGSTHKYMPSVFITFNARTLKWKVIECST